MLWRLAAIADFCSAFSWTESDRPVSHVCHNLEGGRIRCFSLQHEQLQHEQHMCFKTLTSRPPPHLPDRRKTARFRGPPSRHGRGFSCLGRSCSRAVPYNRVVCLVLQPKAQQGRPVGEQSPCVWRNWVLIVADIGVRLMDNGEERGGEGCDVSYSLGMGPKDSWQSPTV